MSDTVRGVIIFFAALMTIGLWAPLRNHPERTPDGTIVTQSYFGLFTYGTLHTELKEPDYKMSFVPSYPRLAVTCLATAVLWGAVITRVKKRKPDDA